MSNSSFIGICIAVLLMIFCIIQVGLFIRSINRKEMKRIVLHLIGVFVTLLLTIFLFCQSLDIELSSNFLITATLIMAILFYIRYGFDSLFVTKK